MTSHRVSRLASQRPTSSPTALSVHCSSSIARPEADTPDASCDGDGRCCMIPRDWRAILRVETIEFRTGTAN
jgi:hypothetical protein